ncbi:Uncharacterised protein [Mycobacteroides abscessus subsp. abscessus]|nr:Uncharacterised protein [Mycobacteroides abscessus subsp. abscessus]
MVEKVSTPSPRLPVCTIGTISESESLSSRSTRPMTACTATSAGASPASCTEAVSVSGDPSNGVSGKPELSTSVMTRDGQTCCTRSR